jgi:hypothetical protein
MVAINRVEILLFKMLLQDFSDPSCGVRLIALSLVPNIVGDIITSPHNYVRVHFSCNVLHHLLYCPPRDVTLSICSPVLCTVLRVLRFTVFSSTAKWLTAKSIIAFFVLKINMQVCQLDYFIAEIK